MCVVLLRHEGLVEILLKSNNSLKYFAGNYLKDAGFVRVLERVSQLPKRKASFQTETVEQQRRKMTAQQHGLLFSDKLSRTRKK